MRRITEQHDASRMPALDRWTVTDVRAQNAIRWCRFDDGRNRIVPRSEATDQVTAHISVATFGRRVCHGKPVDLAAADRNDPEAFASPPALSDSLRCGDRVAWCDASPARIARIYGRPVSDELGPDVRVEAVGAHEQFRLDALAVRQRDMHRGTVLLERGDVAAGSDHTEPDGVEKDGMKAGAVQSNQGRAHCLIQLGQVHFRSKLATARVEDRCAADDSA